jgi:DNA invertase Pin-like site-specific DNA recombinase
MGGMKYGYARVSTDDQNPALQLAACSVIGRDLQCAQSQLF